MTVAAQRLSLAPVPALLFAAMNDVAARQVPDWASALIRRRGSLPYACAIAAGCVFTLAGG